MLPKLADGLLGRRCELWLWGNADGAWARVVEKCEPIRWHLGEICQLRGLWSWTPDQSRLVKLEESYRFDLEAAVSILRYLCSLVRHRELHIDAHLEIELCILVTCDYRYEDATSVWTSIKRRMEDMFDQSITIMQTGQQQPLRMSMSHQRLAALHLQLLPHILGSL